MVKKMQKSGAEKKSGIPGMQLPGAVKDSAAQIWQAGLGAFAKAQAEGSKAFESLVKEGTSIQRKTQAAAEEKISEATNRMSAMAGDISSKASGQWDKLENIFEDRVAKALNKLGVPSAKDVNALIARIDELNKSVQNLSSKAAVASKPVPRKAATKAATSTHRTLVKDCSADITSAIVELFRGCTPTLGMLTQIHAAIAEKEGVASDAAVRAGWLCREAVDSPKSGAKVRIRRKRLIPQDQVLDIRNAISYLQGEPNVDRARIGVWGADMAGGHAIMVAATDPRVKAVVAQTPRIEGKDVAKTAVKPGPEAVKLARIVERGRFGAGAE